MSDNEKTKDKKELMRGLKFAMFSASAGIIQFTSFLLLNAFTDWPYWPKYLIALTLSVIWNFTLNRRYTFRSAGNVPVAMMKVALFYAVFTPISTLVGNYLAEECGWNDVLVMVLTGAVNFITEYLYDRFFVFNNSLDTNIKSKDH